MSERTFVDTNVWVYAVDGVDPVKQARARTVLAPSPGIDLVVSSQVLSEFYVTVTRKLALPVSEDEARLMLESMRRLPVVAIDADHVTAAVDGCRTWRISYWDALVVTAAASAGCSRILSEDLADGEVYGSVRVENPFRPMSRVSESRAADYQATTRRSKNRWDDEDLAGGLAHYERACRDAGMTRNAVHSYWDYARRFLDWRTGGYRPRGATARGRPTKAGPVTADDLAADASAYARAIESSGRAQATVDTYYRHAMFFIRWLRGDFAPGGRLR